MEKVIKQTIIRGYDPLIGYAYSDSKDIPLKEGEEYKNGLIYIGNKSNPSLKIAILGGSTSDISYDGSWIRPLYNLLKEQNVLIISGAMSGYSTSQEVLKLIRDILPLNPDIVISLSGVNDLGFIQATSQEHPMIHNYQARIGRFLVDKYGSKDNKESFFNKFSNKAKIKPTGMNHKLSLGNLILGTKVKTSAAKNWYNNIRLQKAICQEFDIKYISFLQPIFGTGKYNYTNEELEIYESYVESKSVHGVPYDLALKEFYNEAREIAKKVGFIVDIVDVFENQTDMYADTRHPNSKGNKIIAKKIFEEIKKLLNDKK